MKFISTFAYT